MGVATRGVKFKFTAGERVLCYEPDPTKAKVLYESKVLDLVVSRDDRGRKVPEYLIHFFGWNSSWDRCVREEFILPFTEENRELQTKLANEAALSLKGRHKRKLPPLIKETLYKKQCIDSCNEKSENQESSPSGSDSESSEDETDKDVTLNIPEVLKFQLEDDWRCVTKKHKLVKLPCTPNVITILENYVKHLAAKLLCASPPKNSKNGKQLMPDDVQNKLNLCKETMDGIRVYFDFTLPHLLLYRQEKKQFYTDGLTCSPYIECLRELSEGPLKMEIDTNHDPTPKTDVSPGRLQRGRLSRSQKSPTIVKTEPDHSPETKPVTEEKCFKKPTRGRPRMTSTRILRSSDKPKQNIVKNQTETLAEESTSANSLEVKRSPSSEIRHTRKSTQNEALPEESNATNLLEVKRSPTSEVRLTRKCAHNETVPEESTVANSVDMKRSPTSEIRLTRKCTHNDTLPEESNLANSLEGKRSPTSEIRLTRKSTHNETVPEESNATNSFEVKRSISEIRLTRKSTHNEACAEESTVANSFEGKRSPSIEIRLTRKCTHNETLPEESTITNLLEVKRYPSSEIRFTRKCTQVSTSNDPVEKGISLPHCPSNSNSSEVSTTSSPKLGQQYHLIHDAALLWRIIPQHVYQQIPAPPSLIYGAHHLLRLLVKLPEMISKMSISSRKLQNLLYVLENFLIYLAEQKDKLFVPSMYVDSCDDF